MTWSENFEYMEELGDAIKKSSALTIEYGFI